MRVIAQPMPANPTLPMSPMPTNPTLPAIPTLPASPTPTAVTTMATSTQIPVTRPTTATTNSIPVTVYNLAQGKFKGISYTTRKSQGEGGFSFPIGNSPSKEQHPKLQPLPQPHRAERTPHGQVQ